MAFVVRASHPASSRHDACLTGFTCTCLQVRRVVRALSRAGGDDRVRGLVAYIGDATAIASLAVGQELRAGVHYFRWLLQHTICM